MVIIFPKIFTQNPNEIGNNDILREKYQSISQLKSHFSTIFPQYFLDELYNVSLFLQSEPFFALIFLVGDSLAGQLLCLLGFLIASLPNYNPKSRNKFVAIATFFLVGTQNLPLAGQLLGLLGCRVKHASKSGLPSPCRRHINLVSGVNVVRTYSI